MNDGVKSKSSSNGFWSGRKPLLILAVLAPVIIVGTVVLLGPVLINAFF